MIMNEGTFHTIVPESLYFAYGSNLQLEQMRRRCPESRYMGVALLRGYRWQINQRGYANVIPSQNDVVTGLCFLLTANDEARLDLNEGVAVGAYDKELVVVELLISSATLVGRKVSELIGLGLVQSSLDDGRSDVTTLPDRDQEQVNQKGPGVDSQPVNHTGPGNLQSLLQANESSERVHALLYISRKYTREGDPLEEYVDRMNLGIRDSLTLGFPKEYVETYIRNYIHE